MPTLSPSTGSVSSLIKSATSLAAANQTFQDAQAAFDYETNVIIDPVGAFNTYKQYLQGRISTLTTLGGPTNGTKAISLTNTMNSALSKSASTQITQENIQVMAGNATPTDKYNLIGQEYTRAIANGDLSLAQSLMSQSYSLSQTIQEQAQTSAAASLTLATASGNLKAKGEEDVATTLTKDLTAFNTAYAHAGSQNANQLLTQFVNDHKAAYATLGVVLKQGVKPNYFDVVSGTNQAIFAAHNAAGDAVAPYAQDGGQSYYDKANAVVGNIPTIYGKMNANQLTQAANNPNSFATKLDPDFVGTGSSGVGGNANPQIGYKYDPKLGIIPVTASSPWINIPNNLNYRLQQLGLNVIGNIPKAGQGTNNSIEVTASKNTPSWLLKAIPSNATTHVLVQANGDIQFESQGKSGVGIFTATANNQLFERSGTDGSYTRLSGEPGGGQGLKASSSGGVANDGVNGAGGPHLSLSSDFANVNAITAKAQALQNETATIAANQKAALAMLPTSVPALPNITIAPPTATAPAPPAVVQKATYPVAPKTVNPQAPAGVNLQGGSTNLQGGGTGIKL